MSSSNLISRVLGVIPNRLQLAGGWIDQPFVSRHNPKAPGSMVVVRGVRFTLDGAGEEPPVFMREFERVYEAPIPRYTPRLDADFVGTRH